MYDVIIAGGGPAGLTAAIYAVRGGLSSLVLERAFAGGQLALGSVVENYPGLEADVSGAVLADRMEKQAKRLGAAFKTEEIRSFDLAGVVKKIVTSKNTYEAKTVILAMGASPRPLGVKGADALVGSGVSYCATCDGAFFRGADVAVVGGGNTAVEDALYLSRLCGRVYLVHRRDQFRAQRALVDLARSAGNVEMVLSCVPAEVKGEFAVESLVVEHVKSGERRELPVKGVFAAIGQIPKTGLVEGRIALDDARYIVSDESCRTNIPGVFCAGDVRTKRLRQIVTAAADGAVAATAAAEYILEESKDV